MLKGGLIKTVILLLVSNIVFAQIPTDYIVYLPFNGTTENLALGATSVIENGATFQYVQDRHGNNSALQFNGVDNYLNCGEYFNLNSEVTVSLWVNTTYSNSSTSLFLIEKYNGLPGYDAGFSLHFIDTDEIRFAGRNHSNTFIYTKTANSNICDGQWHHIVGMVDNGVWKIYIDDEFVSSYDTQNPTGSLDVSDNLIIGNLFINNDYNRYYNGVIDDVRIYDYALSKSDITALYNERATTTSSNMWSENGSDIYRLTGNVGIGTTDPGSYKLAVEGIIGAHEIKVTTDGWADFVFEENYSLMSLSELDAYIKANRHLPEIPTTEEVEENGISVGEMNAKLLQKIEELTLYLIEMKKENDELKTRVEKLEKKN